MSLSSSNFFASVVGTGMYMPDRVVTNQDLEQLVATTDEWIASRTGIRERRIASDEQATSDLAVRAAQVALESAQVTPEQVDVLILATMTPDYMFPATACLIQHQLGCSNAGAFDLNAACTGFIYGLKNANALIKSGEAKTVLLIGAEVMSSVLNWQDRNTCVLFGDGAGAVVLQPAPMPGIVRVNVYADGSLAPLIMMRAGGSRKPTTAETVANQEHYLEMGGREVFRHAIRVIESGLTETLQQAGWSVGDLDLVIPHQANIRIIDTAVERLGIDSSKMVVNLQNYGNTSGATIPVGMYEALQQGRIQPGTKIAMIGFGAGFTWGVALIEWV